jgi:predicted N-acetyltransferase YhbS
MKASHTSIRPACVEDVPAIVTLLRNVFIWAYGQVIPQKQLAVFLEAAFADAVIAHDLQRSEVLLYVAELADDIVGVARLEPNQIPHSSTDTNAIELTKCYILPEYHGQGIADALVHEMLRLAAESGWQHMWLCVWQ